MSIHTNMSTIKDSGHKQSKTLYSVASAVAKANKIKHTKALITQTDQISYIKT